MLCFADRNVGNWVILARGKSVKIRYSAMGCVVERGEPIEVGGRTDGNHSGIQGGHRLRQSPPTWLQCQFGDNQQFGDV
jgi:hypothetical protein